MARSDHRKGELNFPFVAIPKAILQGQDWPRMSARAIKLMLDLMAQYTGRNNGRLSPSWEAMQRCGWTSRDQLWKAKSELLGVPWAIETRKGRPPSTSAWVGFTWWPLHWHESMDVGPRDWPMLNFVSLADARIDPNEGREKLKRKTVSLTRHTGRLTPKRPVIDPPHGSMEAQS